MLDRKRKRDKEDVLVYLDEGSDEINYVEEASSLPTKRKKIVRIWISDVEVRPSDEIIA